MSSNAFHVALNSTDTINKEQLLLTFENQQSRINIKQRKIEVGYTTNLDEFPGQIDFVFFINSCSIWWLFKFRRQIININDVNNKGSSGLVYWISCPQSQIVLWWGQNKKNAVNKRMQKKTVEPNGYFASSCLVVIIGRLSMQIILGQIHWLKYRVESKHWSIGLYAFIIRAVNIVFKAKTFKNKTKWWKLNDR